MSISRLIRKLVIERAGNRCEYCRIPQAITNYDFHIEHIIGIQHGGDNSLENLAWCCAFCNWKKGPNIGTILDSHSPIIPLFNPRTQKWFDHFETRKGHIIPKTDIGQATAKLLEFNLPERIEIRELLIQAGYYP
ncbi:MAG: HNH endonuclease signature motif containing protein [Bacteroidia bacterium]|nr:HNH endonuclease signature motif containing protein [Bacteroidia bacterium]